MATPIVSGSSPRPAAYGSPTSSTRSRSAPPLLEPLPHQIGGLRRDAAPPAAALPARRRPRRRQDDHGGSLHQGADAPRGPRRASSSRRADSWRSGRTSCYEKFGLSFADPHARDDRATTHGNPFVEQDLLIARLDHLSRNETSLSDCVASEWDLVVVDEAHRCRRHYLRQRGRRRRSATGSASASGQVARHLLLMTATPHSGKEEDFQLFLALLDRRPFAGRAATAAHGRLSRPDAPHGQGEAAALRRPAALPGAPGDTVTYPLSDAEAELYGEVTDYVTEEMNRADDLSAEGEGRRGNLSASRSRCSSAAWPRRPRRSTSRSAAGASGSRNRVSEETAAREAHAALGRPRARRST